MPPPRRDSRPQLRLMRRPRRPTPHRPPLYRQKPPESPRQDLALLRNRTSVLLRQKVHLKDAQVCLRLLTREIETEYRHYSTESPHPKLHLWINYSRMSSLHQRLKQDDFPSLRDLPRHLPEVMRLMNNLAAFLVSLPSQPSQIQISQHSDLK